MCELYIELLTTRLQHDPLPVSMLSTLALIFDVKNDWNHKNRDQAPRGGGAGGQEGEAIVWATPQVGLLILIILCIITF